MWGWETVSLYYLSAGDLGLPRDQPDLGEGGQERERDPETESETDRVEAPGLSVTFWPSPSMMSKFFWSFMSQYISILLKRIQIAL